MPAILAQKQFTAQGCIGRGAFFDSFLDPDVTRFCGRQIGIQPGLFGQAFGILALALAQLGIGGLQGGFGLLILARCQIPGLHGIRRGQCLFGGSHGGNGNGIL